MIRRRVDREGARPGDGTDRRSKKLVVNDIMASRVADLFCSKEAQRGNHYMYSTNTTAFALLIFAKKSVNKQEEDVVRIVS